MKTGWVVGTLLLLVFLAIALMWKRSAPRNERSEGANKPPEVKSADIPPTESAPAAAASGAPPAVPPFGKLPAGEMEALVKRLQAAEIPVEERQAELQALAKQGGREAVDTLMAIGNERIYLGPTAVELLGSVPDEDSKEERLNYLRAKLDDNDPRVLSAAVRAYAQLGGDEAIPVLAEIIRRNRTRPDGHEDAICYSAVRALGETNSPAAVSILREELERSEEPAWSLEYGSSVVAALVAVQTVEARAAAGEYAERLAGRVPEDPLAGEYYRQKIAEARRAAGLEK